MRIVVAAVGRLKQGPERELAERYRTRAADAGRSVGLNAFANIVPDGAVTVILDERGENVSSAHIAGRLQDWQRQDTPAVVFIIGAADGLAPSLREKASLAIAFGAATWPHQLIRIMLLEQLYRAVTILAGHPITARDRPLPA